MIERIKYPRTLHLPWSEGISSDDGILGDVSHFVGKTVVVTEKMDGENTTLYRDCLHARSLDSRDHESRHLLKAQHAAISYMIPGSLRICGENLYAQHSIPYDALESYFYVFSVWDNDTGIWRCMDWKDTRDWAAIFEFPLVPTLYYGIWDEAKVRACYTGISQCGGAQEGYVVRLADAFSVDEFDRSIAKFVRKGHVQTDEHWMHKAVIPNKLKG